MDLSAAVAQAEKSLRMVVRELLPEWKSRPGAPATKALEKLRRSEQAKRVGAYVSNDLLDFTYLSDLENIINSNRADFAPVFPPDDPHVDSLLTSLRNYRNTINHSREIVPAERTYLSGVCGLITNLITKYKSDPGDAERYFPRIISIKHHLGVELTGDERDERGFPKTVTGPPVEVGATVTFDCEGSDPRERELIWTLEVSGTGLGTYKQRAEARGSTAQLVWNVEDSDYASDRLRVRLTTQSRYKRNPTATHPNFFEPGYDDERSMYIRVLPPWKED